MSTDTLEPQPNQTNEPMHEPGAAEVPLPEWMQRAAKAGGRAMRATLDVTSDALDAVAEVVGPFKTEPRDSHSNWGDHHADSRPAVVDAWLPRSMRQPVSTGSTPEAQAQRR